MWNVITLDGYFEGKQNWDLDFHNLIWGEELEKLSIEQLNAADYLVFGRVTYEGMAAYWKNETGEIAELMRLPYLPYVTTCCVYHYLCFRCLKRSCIRKHLCICLNKHKCKDGNNDRDV